VGPATGWQRRLSLPGRAEHVECAVDQIVVDQKLKLVSTPAYMLGPWIAPVAAGIDKLVGAVLEMA
jgi:enhancing lycopene biosynthesis protein 2